MKNFKYTATVNGQQLKPRNSDREYTHCVVATVPVNAPNGFDGEYFKKASEQAHKKLKGQTYIVSCHADECGALTSAIKAGNGKGGTVATWTAYLAGAEFSVHPLQNIKAA